MRQSSHVGRGVCQINLGLATASKAWENLATTLVPLRQLVGNDWSGVFALVQACNERRAASVSAANIKRPTDESAVLVGVEVNGVASGQVDTVLGNLKRTCQHKDGK